MSQLVSESVSDKHNQWSDSGPITSFELPSSHARLTLITQVKTLFRWLWVLNHCAELVVWSMFPMFPLRMKHPALPLLVSCLNEIVVVIEFPHIM